MQLDKAIEIVKLVIAAKNDRNEITIKDTLQFSIAITVISNNLSVEQIQELLN